jgi:alcohol dehydrogenase class IV
MKDIAFRVPAQIEVGLGRVDRLRNFLADRGLKRVLLLVDSKVNKLGLAEPLLANFKELRISYELFDGIKNEPTVKEFDGLATRFGNARAFDAVIGLGGGSVLDVAKILSVAEAFTGSIKRYLHAGVACRRERSLVLVPTTSGTGSEATPNAVLNDEEDRCKKALISDCLMPDFVIIDPELTLSLPPGMTAETGLDAFTHGIECFIGKKSNPMSDLFALEAVRLIAGNLRKALAEGTNREARYNMALASLYGGIAIANSGTGGVHALAYPLGGEHGIGHGLSNSILLSEVMDFSAEAVPDKFLEIGDAMGVEQPAGRTDRKVKRVLAEIRNLVRDADVKLVGRSFTEGMIDSLAGSAMTVERLLANNPRPISYEDARRIYRRALLV